MNPIPRHLTLQNRAEDPLPAVVGLGSMLNLETSRKTFLARNTRSLLLSAASALVCGALAFGFQFATRPYSASVRLVMREQMFGNAAEVRDFIALASSPTTLAAVAHKLPERMSNSDLSARCRIKASEGGSAITLTAISSSPSGAILLVNAFGERVVDCSTEWNDRNRQDLELRLIQTQRRLQEINKQLTSVRPGVTSPRSKPIEQTVPEESARVAGSIRLLQSQLHGLRVEETNLLMLVTRADPSVRNVEQSLNTALTHYTDEHPKVQELRAALAALRKQTAEAAEGFSDSPSGLRLVEVRVRRSVLEGELRELGQQEIAARGAANALAGREMDYASLQSEFEILSRRRDDLLQDKILSLGKSMQLWQAADATNLTRGLDVPQTVRATSLASILGALTGFIVIGLSSRRRRVEDEATLEAATQLPLLPRLDLLQRISAAERDCWATATLAAMEKLSGQPKGSTLVCGVTSSTSGEGRSTWMNLLAEAGGRRGNRVLVISRPDSPGAENQSSSHGGSRSALTPVLASSLFSSETSRSEGQQTSQAIVRLSFAPNASHPAFRRTWEHALAAWRGEENALILVELPPASTAEGLLLASGMPNVLWISGLGIADVALTRKCLMNLRNMNTQLIAAALNSCPSAPKRSRLRALFAALFVLFAVLPKASAAEPPTAVTAAKPNGLSVTKAAALAPWQEKLTLGSGDVFDISLYGQPDTLRPGMVVGPDGRISFLQATDVLVSGLTVEELRAKLEGILGKFHLAPRVVIVPTAFNSKKYFILGNVNQRGAYQLDRPTTIVEAIAKAHGFVTTPQQRNSLMLADLPHAFLMRRQADGEFKRETVDFEALFLQGDLKQNRLLAPEDYLYFPPLGLQEIYVVGEVRNAGAVTFARNMTTIAAIAGRGGFKDKAYRERVLVVRGSLQHPETIVVDTASILRATSPDFALKPRDIVYVSRRPWAKAEELAELAISDFLRALVIGATGAYVGPSF
ncbi:MAG TPA: SLBB domain-containing protein [Candidatus Saccharimonadales bacterium]|nr:SLBB domain-containing protein [Candidatus Saccharimonadales bacterium]